MTKAQIDAVSIGKEFVWGHDKAAPHSNETAVAYHIDNLPSHLIAYLRRTPGDFGRWLFEVTGGPESLNPENSYDSKGEALAALKDWLGQHG